MLYWIYRLWVMVTLPLLTLVRPIRLGAHAIVVDEAGAVLLVRQTYRRGWYFPGGGVNRRETMETAAIREAYEETGVIATGTAELLGVYSHLHRRYSDHMAVYVIRSWRREDQRSFEISETRFFNPDALPADVSPGVRRRIEEYLGQRERSAVW